MPKRKKINDEYDIGAAFEAIEEELIASMIRNMRRHKVEEINEDKQWSMWQAEQLRSLEKYRKQNQKKFGAQFKSINAKIKALISAANDEGMMDQEEEILKEILRGFPNRQASSESSAEFFKLNERKLDALIKATMDDMKSAETAVLRMAEDRYRKVIFNAQVYANGGAGTYEKAVDMATRDFLSAGLNCIEYSNGARHTLADYADMAIRTASKRAYLQGEGTKRKEWGISTVIMNKRGNPCPKCLPFVGKVLIDDVWSGGPKDGRSPVTGIKYPLMSSAIAAGLYHPRCRDSHTTYFEGISTPPADKYTKQELNDLAEQAQQEARQQYAERQEERFGRLADYSLDPGNKKRYAVKRDEWKRAVEKSQGSGIMKMELQKFATMPEGKFTEYALNFSKAPDKAAAFEKALGYTLDNYSDLIENIKEHLDERRFVEKGDNGYGMRYEYVMRLKGPNGKEANVLTSWIRDEDNKRLTSVYVTNKEVTK